MVAQSHLVSSQHYASPDLPSAYYFSGPNFVNQSWNCSSSRAWPIAGDFSFCLRNGDSFPIRKRDYIEGLTASFTVQHILGKRINSSSGGAKQTAEDDVMNDIRVLVDDSLELREVVNFSNRGIGVDMRDRVNRLYERVSLLKVTAERDVRSCGRVSAQLIATLKGLQREQNSLGKIVQLAMEASPVLTGSDLYNSRESRMTVIQRETNSAFRTEEIESTNEVDSMNSELLKVRKRESSSKVADVPKYVMTAPESEGPSPLAAFRAEIERRVREQLVGKQGNSSGTSHQTMIPSPTSLQSEAQRRQKFQKAENENDGIVGQTTLDSNSGLNNLIHEKDSQLWVPNARQSGQVVYPDGTFKTVELERLKSQLGSLQEAFKGLQRESARANLAAAKVRNLEMENARSISIDLHEQTVSRVKGALIEARARVTQITGEVREKEAMLVAMKEDVMAEQQKLFEKVEELTNDIGRRVTAEEMNNALRKTLDEIEEELKSAHDHVKSLDIDLERKETMILSMQEEWKADKKVLKSEMVDINNRISVIQKALEDMSEQDLLSEVTSVKDRLADLQEERKHEQSQLFEAQQKVKLLEDQIVVLTQRADDAEVQKESQRQALLDSVKTLVTDMLKDQEKLRNESMDAHQNWAIKASPKKENKLHETQPSHLRKSDLELEPSFSRALQESAIREGFQLSDERTVYLGSFIAVIGQLIRQEIARMIAAPAKSMHQSSLQISGAIANSTCPEGRWDDLLGINNIHKDGQKEALQSEKTITLLYESSWEIAFVHCSADSTGWTKPPGILMSKADDLKGNPCKVFKVKSSTLEFVLTDGEGHWDRDPSGKNYKIREPGSFFLSAGVLKPYSVD